MMVHICYKKGEKNVSEDNDSFSCINGIANIVVHCEDGSSSLYIDSNVLKNLAKRKEGKK